MARLTVLILGMLSLIASACQMPSHIGRLQEAPPGALSWYDVIYAEPDGVQLELDLQVPPGTKPVPLVIWVHGGSWLAGDRGDPPTLPLLNAGYAVASVDYRLTDDAIFPAQIHDVKAAVRYLRANAARYRLDPNRFGVWGDSAGGHLAALLGTTSARGELEGDEGVTGVSSRVQAVVDFYGPTDFLAFKAQLPKDASDADSPDSPTSRLLGGPVPQFREQAKMASPITYVTKDAPPFFVLHGDRDDVVPLQQSVALVEALKRVNADVVFVVVRGRGHADAAYFEDDTIAKVRAFFDLHLKGNKPS